MSNGEIRYRWGNVWLDPCDLPVYPDDPVGTNGRTWAAAYTTIQAALDAASTNANECTQILIAPHATCYNIDTAGDPIWTGNYIIANAGTRISASVWSPGAGRTIDIWLEIQVI